MVRFRRFPNAYSGLATAPNHMSFRISPNVQVAFGMLVMVDDEKMTSALKDLKGTPAPVSDEKDAYERVLTDAMEGDATLFARQDYVEVVNKTGFENPFGDGTAIRGTVDFPVNIADRKGHQGVIALYSNKNGKDLTSIGDTLLPPFPAAVAKNHRYYFAYTFDQYLYQSKANSKESVGLFGQFGISDGNPNRLY
jgi:Glucose-6-phosphate dehydrogenase, C-terminal domain/Carbohydrate-selective porin, OprB family